MEATIATAVGTGGLAPEQDQDQLRSAGHSPGSGS